MASADKYLIPKKHSKIIRQYADMQAERLGPSRDAYYRQRIVDLCHRLTLGDIQFKRYRGFGWKDLVAHGSHDGVRFPMLNRVLYKALVLRDLDLLFDEARYQRNSHKAAQQVNNQYKAMQQRGIDGLMRYFESCRITLGVWLGFGTLRDEDATHLRAYLNIDPHSFDWEAMCNLTQYIYDNYWIKGKFPGMMDADVLVDRHDSVVLYGGDLEPEDFLNAVQDICDQIMLSGMRLESRPTDYYLAPNPTQRVFADDRGPSSFHMQLADLAEMYISEILKDQPGKRDFQDAVQLAMTRKGIFTAGLVKRQLAL